MASLTAGSDQINMRASAQARSLIDRAAKASGKNRTEFMLQASVEKAQEVLLDQRIFHLDEAQTERFLELLDAPLKSGSKLKALLGKKPLWDGDAG